MKDEYGGTPIIEFIGSKPKSYWVTDVNNCEKNIKGIILILEVMNLKI